LPVVGIDTSLNNGSRSLAGNLNRGANCGLVAALTLRRAEIEVQLFEQAAGLREIGTGIQISPNAGRILERLGLPNSMREYDCGR
jgi:2-polyprenyl-6-methoxyphenol hydroxylase-like FAD-dependent oxidoreductase